MENNRSDASIALAARRLKPHTRATATVTTAFMAVILVPIFTQHYFCHSGFMTGFAGFVNSFFLPTLEMGVSTGSVATAATLDACCDFNILAFSPSSAAARAAAANFASSRSRKAFAVASAATHASLSASSASDLALSCAVCLAAAIFLQRSISSAMRGPSSLINLANHRNGSSGLKQA